MVCMIDSVIYYVLSLENRLERENYVLAGRPEIIKKDDGLMSFKLNLLKIESWLEIAERRERARQIFLDEAKDYFGSVGLVYSQEKEIDDVYRIELDVLL